MASPAVSEREAPISPPELPTVTLIAPAVPCAAVPVSNVREPVFPKSADPVETETSPLFICPLAKLSGAAVPTDTLALVVAELTPTVKRCACA